MASAVLPCVRGPASSARGAAYDDQIVSSVSESPAAVTARVPAKVNLQLAVGPARADGYHPLVTVFHAVSLFDEVTVRQAERTSLTVTGENAAAVPANKTNLAWRAAAAVAAAAGRKARAAAVRIEIRKRIPVAAGLAGGSADAAATLVACNELWQAGLSAAELRQIGADLGSDVPFALLGGTAVGRGRGEELTRALASGNYHWALAFASEGLSTAEVYATCDRLRAARAQSKAAQSKEAQSKAAQSKEARAADGEGGAQAPALSHELMAALRSGDPAAVGQFLSNDLQPAALSLQPALRRTLAAGREYGALGAIVSGSGPTCAFLAKSAAHAREIAVALTGAGVCRAVARASGPVPGAALVRQDAAS
jgi:4-diphosphocytidyl-2-C-methyl-D-erythritol kinase